jgi:hypothetical protein
MANTQRVTASALLAASRTEQIDVLFEGDYLIDVARHDPNAHCDQHAEQYKAKSEVHSDHQIHARSAECPAPRSGVL